ncbi:carboxypeptidase [Diaporthe amygdali]|uniref:carboxypeptidase n=1 Tax=Phomopsis amygdali TaxID=1214568 RepID=UPI0022FEC6D4|nr:carboxypeptidase [Diaporthe amygdali]KAJ0121970.1 carboxypeptidase [Diaporthe amygdali]
MWSLQQVAFTILLLRGVASQTQYGGNSVRVVPDPPIVESRAFSAPNATLYSPSFLLNASFPQGWAEGTAGATSEYSLHTFLQSLADRNPSWMKYQTADFDSEEGRAFPYVVLSSGSANSSINSLGNGKLKVWLQGGVHGNEPAGDEALLALLGKMDANHEWATSILATQDIVVLPRYNPDGISYFQRTLATNYDPNRDHIKLARQQTRDIKELFSGFGPHIAVDMHEYGASSRYATNYSNAADGMYSAAKNLNIYTSIRNISEALFAKNVGSDLTAAGLRGEPYMTSSSSSNPVRLVEAGSDAKIGRNAMGLTQTVTFLFETRGIGIASQEFKRRTYAGLTMVSSILQTAADNFEEVYDTLENGIQEFIESEEDIVVTDYTTPQDRTWTMVNRYTGDVVQLPVQFESNTPAVANLTRPRPKAYLIPTAWADLAERLMVSGLDVEKLKDAYAGTVVAYNITSASLATSYYEGVVLSSVTAEPVDKTVSLPPGSFLRVSEKKKKT